MKKSEIKNLILQGWSARDSLRKERQKKGSEATKKWKLREQEIKNGSLSEPPSRNKQYRPPL